MINQTTQKSSIQSGGLSELTLKYIKNWYFFGLSIIICMATIYIYLYSVTPQYKVSSTLFIQDDKRGNGISKESAFSDLNMFISDKTVENEIEVLRSRDLIYKVLKNLSLETAYFEQGRLKDEELYGKTLPIKVTVFQLKNQAYAKKLKLVYVNESSFLLSDSTTSHLQKFGQTIMNKDYTIRIDKGVAFKENFGVIKLKFKNLYNLTESYSLGKLKIQPVVKDANTIILSLTDNIPQRGIDVLTNLITNYNSENINKKNIIALNTIRFIDNRLKFLINDLTTVEGDVENYKQQNKVTDVYSDAQNNVLKSGEYNTMLSSSTIQLGTVNSLVKYFNSKQSQYNLTPSAMGLRDPILNNLTSRFNDLQLERNRMLRTAKSENPLVLNLNAQLATLKSNIMENLAIIKQGFLVERNNLRSNYYQFDSKVKSVPALERGLLERSREQSVKSSLYKYLLQKREETALSLSTTVSSSQMVDRPAYNTFPESPKEQLFYLGGFIFGCLIPAGIIYGKSLFNNKVKDANSIELTGARILGELTHHLNNNTIVFQQDNRSTISELFRYIRSNLAFMTNENDNKVILVTSGMKGEGKTFFSLNLGTTLSMLGKKVVMLEFDLRKPDLLNKINIKQEMGLTDFISSDSVLLDDIIKPSKISSDLFVVGCGTIPEHPAEIMNNAKIQLLIEDLKQRFDYIILDTSPVGQVADAFSLARFADVSIYLVRYNYTHKFQLGILKDICENNKLNNPMVVFNDAKREKGQTYGYSGYGYSFSN